MTETHQFPQDCTYLHTSAGNSDYFLPSPGTMERNKNPLSSILQLPMHLFYSTLKVMFHDSLFERQTKSK